MEAMNVVALFDRVSDARGALVEVRRRYAWRPVGLRVHVRAVASPASELLIEETDASRATFHGAGWGAFGGLMAAGMGAFITEHGQAFDIPTVVFSLFAGVVIGTLGGALLGPTSPSLALGALSKLATTDGALVLTVETTEKDTHDVVEQLFRKHHAHFRGAHEDLTIRAVA